MNALERLAGWAVGFSAETNPTQYQKAVDWALVALVDTVGVMIGGAEHPSPTLAFETVAAWGHGYATVVGRSETTAAPFAAFVNGAAAHALDFNAWDELTASHTSPVLLAALLAVAEQEGKSGKAVIEAFVVGMEVAMRIGLAVNLDHYHIGWHTTSTVAMIGCAAAVGRLLGLDAVAMGHAISIATSHAAGFKSQFGTPMKPIHAGMGARNGVVSAYLAWNRVAASAETLDGDWSFLKLHATDEAPGFEPALATLGERLLLAEYGVVVKPYPSCAYTHRAIGGLLDLMDEVGFSAETVTSITATIPFFNASILPHTQPTDDTQARFCMAYCLATALLYGTVLPEHFEEDVIFEPERRAWLDRISLETHPVSAESGDLTKLEPAVVTVQLTDGSQLTKSTDYARGMPQRPLSRTELEAKFRGMANDGRIAVEPDKLLAMLWEFGAVEQVGTMMKQLKPARNLDQLEGKKN